MKNVLMSLALVASLIVVLPSCKKYTQEELDNAVTIAANENFDLGYQAGKTDGFALGLQEGYKKAVDDFKTALEKAKLELKAALEALPDDVSDTATTTPTTDDLENEDSETE